MGPVLSYYGLAWEEGARNIRVRHICREGPSGVQDRLGSITFNRRNGIVIQFGEMRGNFRLYRPGMYPWRGPGSMFGTPMGGV